MLRVPFFLVSYATLTGSLFGQVVDLKIKGQINALKKLKVDTFLIYSIPCAGSIPPDGSCNLKETQYLFWLKQNVCFYMEFDYCKNYKPILVDSLNPICFYLLNKKHIDKEIIKPPTYIESKKGNITNEVSVFVDHTCFYEMTFLLGAKKTFKTANDFNLTKAKLDNGKKNIYYKYNQLTKTKALIDLTNELVKKLSPNQAFTSD